MTDTASLVYIDKEVPSRQLRPYSTIEWPSGMPESHRAAVYAYHEFFKDWRVTIGFNTGGLLSYLAANGRHDEFVPALKEIFTMIWTKQGKDVDDEWMAVRDTAYSMSLERND